ncbi:hypothetical protein [Henriciella marina]|uniref:hypothetical protein n=1 Tax=Henriciella marina TaxID=453851 RepID=UPI0003735D80|nr:hypothetical protein [Henriciella marina]
MALVGGTAKIRHAETGQIFEILSSELEFETTSADERQMGFERGYEARVDHPYLGELIWMVWEYPSGVENYRESSVEPHTLLEDFTFDFSEGEFENQIAERRRARIQQMVEWFFERFEDPAHETPYNGREGGYLYIHGGPYSAADELWSNFANEDDELIDAAVAEIESDGTVDWAPVRGSDYDVDEPEPWADSQNDPQFPNEIDEIIAGLAPQNSYPAFELDESGIVRMVQAPDKLPPEGNQEILSELLANARSLRQALLGTNAHVALLSVVERYFSVLEQETFSVSQLYSRGVSLEIGAEVAAQAIQGQELPSLTIEADTYLNAVLSLHGSYIMSDPVGANLVRASAEYQRSEGGRETASTAIRDIQQAVEDLPELFEESVRSEISLAVKSIGLGAHPERSNQIAVRTVGNLVAGILSGLKRHAGTALLSGILIESATGSSLIVGGAAHFDAVVAFLSANASSFRAFFGAFGADTGWVSPLTRLFDRIGAISLPQN